jgi:hypothetical protein
MKTVREWLNELPEEIRERAIRNAEESTWNHLGNQHHCLDEALGDAFSWALTVEDYDFWSRWHYWLLDPTQPKPTIKPENEVESDHIPDVRKMVGEPDSVGRGTHIENKAKPLVFDTLSRRDQFAMAAMQGYISGRSIQSPESVAINAVNFADALIEQLDKNQ